MNLMKKIKSSARNIAKQAYLFMLRFIFTDARFKRYQDEFLLIPNCKDIDLKNQYQKGNLIKLKRPIIEYYNELYELILKKVESKEGYTIVRSSDGEAYFLQGKMVGNISRRHFTKNKELSQDYISLFKEGLLKCDSRHCEMYRRNQKMYQRIYKKHIFSNIPFECIYALMASGKLLTTELKIGIIGSNKKLEIIKKLLNFSQYKEYIGRDGFQDYIGIPNSGSSNNIEELATNIQAQLKDKIDIYLVGIGISKLAVMHRLKEKSKSVFLDAGGGISALAGFAGYERQYFADWINFRLKDYDYEGVDKMDADERLKTIYL